MNRWCSAACLHYLCGVVEPTPPPPFSLDCLAASRSTLLPASLSLRYCQTHDHGVTLHLLCGARRQMLRIRTGFSGEEGRSQRRRNGAPTPLQPRWPRSSTYVRTSPVESLPGKGARNASPLRVVRATVLASKPYVIPVRPLQTIPALAETADSMASYGTRRTTCHAYKNETRADFVEPFKSTDLHTSFLWGECKGGGRPRKI